MIKRLSQILKVTAVRLTLLYTALFSILAVTGMVYISYNSGQLLLSQFQVTIEEEVQDIVRFTKGGDVRRLIPTIERRSRRPGANLYLITDQNSRAIAGNVRRIKASILAVDGWKMKPFYYLGFADEQNHKAVAKVFTLPGDLRLLVGRDIGEVQSFRGVVVRASALSLAVIMLTGILLWYLIGRRALKHIASVSLTSDKIIAGDLSQRLPLSGSGDEFDCLSHSLNALIARVETLNKGVVSMSDSIAHDLKTPLTRLRNRAEAGLNQITNSEQNKGAHEEVLYDIIEDADGLIATFNALLMISQVEAGARTVQLCCVDAVPIMQDVYELFEPSAEERGVVLDLQVDDKITINANRELLAQAFTNLLDNALKYGVDGQDGKAKITLSGEKTDEEVIFSVADNGTGIKAEERPFVVERFVRLEKSRTKPGSGLGLSLVEAVATLHGGKLLLEDNNPGLCVKIVLPLTS